MKPHSTLDYRDLARRRLPHFLFEYIDGGSFAQTTLDANIADLAAVSLRQRVLRDVSAIDLSTALFDQRIAMPLALGPVGLAGLNARRGECQAARAAESAGVPFALSTVSACSLEEVAAATEQPFWFQLYMLRDRGFMREMIARAKTAGCRVMLFTVDLPVPGIRYRDMRSGLAGSAQFANQVRRWSHAIRRPRWAWDVGLGGQPHTLGNLAAILGRKSGIEDFLGWLSNNFDPAATWRDLEFVRREWDGPLVVKGVLDVADARKAAALGADGIVVSNHGGRQLDGTLSSARALPAIAREVGDGLAVLADGGVRSGLDVLRMLALGADGVLLGRAWAYALGAGGEASVRQLLDLFAAELKTAMALTGVTSIGEINTRILAEEPAR